MITSMESKSRFEFRTRVRVIGTFLVSFDSVLDLTEEDAYNLREMDRAAQTAFIWSKLDHKSLTVECPEKPKP
jgi:hypothetical protein